MSNHLRSVRVRNYRSLADVKIDLEPINVLFGPNGAGKSSFLDTIWFVRDCAIRGVDLASSVRSHGIGLLYDGATEDDVITIALFTDDAEYELTLLLSSGQIEPSAGERLFSVQQQVALIERRVGSKDASFLQRKTGEVVMFPLREPEKLSLGRYLDFEAHFPEATAVDNLLRYVHCYHCREFNLYGVKQKGSEAGRETCLSTRGDNLWSVLRNLEARRNADGRYDAIVSYMKSAFPNFDGIIIDATGPTTLYGSFLERGRRREIKASGVSDGHLQLLLLLTALFAEGESWKSLNLFDEPEVSLHPWALAVFANAVKEATSNWNKQVLIATHSPVLLSQFATREIIATEVKDGKTVMQRLSDKPEIQDLLDEYAAGSLYMAQAVAPQEPQAGSTEASAP